MTPEAWLGLIGIGVVVLLSVIGSYVSLSNKLTRLETSMQGLDQREGENRQEHQRIWGKLDNHEVRITRLEPID